MKPLNISPFQDTIAALATPAGRGAVALLRLSGPGAGDVLLSICPSLRGTLPRPRVQRLLPIVHPETTELLDRGLVTWFPEPASYTGENTVEVTCHGGVVTPQLILDAFLAAGARMALPGEFTHRAVLNGKLDLLQAEAVLDLIDGRSRALHRAAINQLDRGLSHRIDRLRGAVLQVEALVVYGIDFPEEDEPPVPPARIQEAARDVVRSIDGLLATAHQGERLREGALVVLAGEPNSGKSSLFNALLGFERAIVTEVPGTTRDAIEGQAEVGGFPMRLIDTAGLRETSDRVEGMGIEVARRYLAAADVILFCIPSSRHLHVAESEFLASADRSRLIVVRTMADLEGTTLLPYTQHGDAVSVSSLSGEGLDGLGRALVSLAFGELVGEAAGEPIITRQRHARELSAARDEIRLFLEAMNAHVPMEFAATHLRSAAVRLEAIVGAITSDDVLGHMFGEFCVGK
ncbi:tRNA uridine-5-carboxymethylaminomethyl(34) synthesis GTPase MnmE [soil metagenome]